MIALPTGISNEAFTKRALVGGIAVMFFMTMFITIFFDEDSEGVANDTMNSLLDGYYDMTGANATNEEIWALTGIYTPYGVDENGNSSSTYGTTADGWVYGARINNYSPSQYGDGNVSTSGIIANGAYGYTVSRDNDAGLYYYTSMGSALSESLEGTFPGIGATLLMSSSSSTNNLTVYYNFASYRVELSSSAYSSASESEFTFRARDLTGTWSTTTFTVQANALSWFFNNDGYFYLSYSADLPSTTYYAQRISVSEAISNIPTTMTVSPVLEEGQMAITSVVTSNMYDGASRASRSWELVADSIDPTTGYTVSGEVNGPAQYVTLSTGTSNDENKLYTRVHMDVSKKSTEFFKTGNKTQNNDGTFYYSFTGYRYSFSPIEDYTASKDVNIVAKTSSCSLIWYSYVGDEGISGQLVLSGSDSGVSVITANEIINSYNTATSASKFTMKFNGTDVYVYIQIDPYAINTLGMSISDCFYNGYWNIMLTTPKLTVSSPTTLSPAIDVGKMWDVTVNLLTFNGESFGLTGFASVLASFVFTISMYTSLLAIGISNPIVLIISMIIGALQAIMTIATKFGDIFGGVGNTLGNAWDRITSLWPFIVDSGHDTLMILLSILPF